MADATESLNSVLSDDDDLGDEVDTRDVSDPKPEAKAKDVEPATEPVTTDKPGTGDAKAKGQEPDVKAKKSTTPVQESDDDVTTDASGRKTVPLKALESERKKRQQAEAKANEVEDLRRRLAHAEGQLSVLPRVQGQPNQQQAEPGISDEEFFTLGPAKFFEKHFGVERERLTKSQQEKFAEMQKATGKLRYGLSRQLMKTVHKDFEEFEGEFEEAARQDPALLAEFRKAENPAQFAYDWAKLRREVDGIGSLEEFETKIEAKVRAKIEAEMREKSAEAEAARVSTSSAGARSTGTALVVSGDEPTLASIVGDD